MQKPVTEKTLQGLRELIEEVVTAGFSTEETVVERAVDAFCDDHDPDDLTPHTESIAREVIAARRYEQLSWPAVTDCDRLDTAFAELERAGVVCRQDFSCCCNCGNGEIRDEMDEAAAAGARVRGYAYYHMQDTERAVQGNTLYLSYGTYRGDAAAALGIGQEILAALRRHGLPVDWDGTLSKRLGIILDWKRRLKTNGTPAAAS